LLLLLLPVLEEDGLDDEYEDACWLDDLSLGLLSSVIPQDNSTCMCSVVRTGQLKAGVQDYDVTTINVQGSSIYGDVNGEIKAF